MKKIFFLIAVGSLFAGALVSGVTAVISKDLGYGVGAYFLLSSALTLGFTGGPK